MKPLAFSELQMEKLPIQKDFWHPSSHRFSQFFGTTDFKGIKNSKINVMKSHQETTGFRIKYSLLFLQPHLKNLKFEQSGAIKFTESFKCQLVLFGKTSVLWRYYLNTNFMCILDYKTAVSYHFTKFLRQSEQKDYIMFSQIKQVWE